MDNVRVVSLDRGKVALVSPYNPGVPPAAKELGGRWNPTASAWVFDARDAERVRELAREIFGTDGTEEPGDKVTVRTKLCAHEDNRASAWFAGREIAHRPARDAQVRLADGVVLVSGTLPGQGGSMRYPRISAGRDVVVEIRDLPRAALSVENPDYYEIVEEHVDVAALRSERERLVARLAEVDALLSAAGQAPEGDA